MIKISLLAITGVVAMLGVTPAFSAEMPTAMQCNDWFAKLDANNDGSLGQTENVFFIEREQATTKTVMDANEIISKERFLDACGKGTLGMPGAQ
jgi:hypothetical protein